MGPYAYYDLWVEMHDGTLLAAPCFLQRVMLVDAGGGLGPKTHAAVAALDPDTLREVARLWAPRVASFFPNGFALAGWESYAPRVDQRWSLRHPGPGRTT